MRPSSCCALTSLAWPRSRISRASRARLMSDLLLGALGPRDREALREQVVAAVAVLDLDHVAGGAEAGHLLSQDDLHVGASSQRAVVVYGRSAISRAFLTARAICRCCWEVTPVTRRARILPRSEMNLRSSAVSL